MYIPYTFTMILSDRPTRPIRKTRLSSMMPRSLAPLFLARILRILAIFVNSFNFYEIYPFMYIPYTPTMIPSDTSTRPIRFLWDSSITNNSIGLLRKANNPMGCYKYNTHNVFVTNHTKLPSLTMMPSIKKRNV